MKNKYISITMADRDRINAPCKSCFYVKVIIIDKIRKFGCGALGGSLLSEYKNTYSQLMDCPEKEKNNK